MFKKTLNKVRENKKGFTLAELLIVVAIIAVLVAISIPIFNTQLEKSRDAVSISNIRAAYAEASAQYLTGDNGVAGDVSITGVQLKGVQSGWSGMDSELSFTHTALTDAIGGAKGTYTLKFSFDANGTCTLSELSKTA